jgi:sugar phosphate isomerase/epimerase
MQSGWTRRLFLGASFWALPGVNLFSSAQGKTRRSLRDFKLGIITDEISQDLSQSLDFIETYHLACCELRDIWKKNIMNASQGELEKAKRLIQEHQLEVTDIASPLFKYNLPEMPAQPSEKRDTFLANFTDQDTEALLRHSVELARFFGTSKIRVFSYWRVEEPGRAYPFVRDRLAKAADFAAKNHVVLVLENEGSCNIGTGEELGRILRDINSPALRGNWDPGNCVALGEIPFPNGYEAVRGLFAHMHIKDARKDPQTGKIVWAPVGSGIIDYRGQFMALRRDGYDGTISLETHYRRADGNPMESTRESLEGLFKIMSALA